MTDETTLQCSGCGVQYIAGTAVCPECLGTDLRPLSTEHEAPPLRPPTYRNFWLATPVVVVIVGYLLLAYGSTFAAWSPLLIVAVIVWFVMRRLNR